MIKQDEYWNEVANKKEFTTPFQPELFLTHVDRDAVILDMVVVMGEPYLN